MFLLKGMFFDTWSNRAGRRSTSSCPASGKRLTCDFTDVDETIRDQLIEECLDPKLRRKFLEKANATLTDLKGIARAHEAVTEQLKLMEKSFTHHSAHVNSVKHNTTQKKGKGQCVVKRKQGVQKYELQKAKAGQSQRCYSCNRFGHVAKDTCCPARDKRCDECGIQGHFAVCCEKTGTRKPRPTTKQENSQMRSKKAFHVAEGAAEREDKYAFVVGGQHETGELLLKVGGVDLGNVLIDSGASCNSLKQKHIECESKKSNKKLFAYGQREPIEVMGTFIAEIACADSGEVCVDEFTVIKGTRRPLLGRSTVYKL